MYKKSTKCDLKGLKYFSPFFSMVFHLIKPMEVRKRKRSNFMTKMVQGCCNVPLSDCLSVCLWNVPSIGARNPKSWRLLDKKV